MGHAPSAYSAVDFDLAVIDYAAPAAGAVNFGLPQGTETGGGGGPQTPDDFDHPPPPTHILRTGGRWVATTAARDNKTRPIYAIAEDRDPDRHRLAWSPPWRTESHQVIPWGKAEQRDLVTIRLRWSPTWAQDHAPLMPWNRPEELDWSRDLPWDASIVATDRTDGLRWNQPPNQDADSAGAWLRSGIKATLTLEADEAYTTVAKREPLDFNLQARGGYRTAPADQVAIDLALESWVSTNTTTNARDVQRFVVPWGQARSIAFFSRWPWGWGHKPWRDIKWGLGYPQDDYTPIDPDGPAPQPDIKLTYSIMNILSIVRLPDRTPLSMRDVTIGLDVDSWAWTFSGTVIGRTNLAMIEPDAGGPKDIEVTINGHVWVFMIERYSGAAKFADERFVVSGVSRTQYMADPYAPKRSKIATSAINAVQAATEELEYTGYTLDWDYQPGDTTPDWTFPAGAFAYQGLTPIEVIKAIADTAGAVVIPKKGADGWTLKPRFPVSPWNIDQAYADAIIHYSMVIDKSVAWQPAPLYDTVFISGINIGKGVEVKRAGQGGQAPGTDVFEPWLVATDVNKERGRQILAASGNHALIDIVTSVPEAQVAPGLIEPGDVLEYQDHSETWRGYVLAVSISAPGSGAVAIKQTAKVIRFYEHG